MKSITLLLIMAFVNSCYIGYPTPHDYMNNPPPGPKSFQYGWQGGCGTGTVAHTPTYYTTMGIDAAYKDQYIANISPDYEIGWQMGYWYCVRAAEVAIGLKNSKETGLL